MQRRRYIELLGLGTGTAFAGSATAMDEHPDDEAENEGEDDPDETDVEVEDEPGPASDTVADPRLGETELMFEAADAYATIDVENLGGAPSGACTLFVEWLDEEGARLDDTNETLPWLDVDETWHAAIRAISPDAAEIEDVEVVGAYEMAYPAIPGPMTVAKSEFQPGDFTSTITGTVENTAETAVDSISAYGRVFDAEGRVLAGDSTTEFDIPTEQDWTFEIRLFDLDRYWDVEDYEVVLDAGQLLMSPID